MASVTRRPHRPKNDPRYDVRYRTAGGDARMRTFRRKVDADQFADNIETDIDRGDFADPKLGRELLGKYADRWLASKPALRPRTRGEYESIIERHIKPTFENVRLNSISTEEVRTWHAEIATTSGQPRAAKCYRTLRAMLNTAVDDGLIARNPCRVRGAGEERPAERPFISSEQVRALLEAMPDELKALVLLAASCSLRLGELLGLRRRSIDLLRGTLTVTEQCHELARKGDQPASVIFAEPKTDAGRRQIAIPKSVLPAIEAHLLTFVRPDADALVFAAPRGGPLPRKTVYASWDVARRQADAPKLHIHDLRHYGATVAAQAGATTKELMARLGHASPRAALIYQHASAERDQEIADAVGDALNVTRLPVRSVGG